MTIKCMKFIMINFTHKKGMEFERAAAATNMRDYLN